MEGKARREYFDSREVLDKKATAFTNLLRSSSNVVFHTGAGISTSAQIPDFRGPKGVWTMRNSGLEWAKNNPLAFEDKIPTFTHMAIAELVRRRLVRHVISQNVDGLHLRSGIPRTQLSELHGNVFREVCRDCKSEVIRDFEVMDPFSEDRTTGRLCNKCGGVLTDDLVDFGENLSSTETRNARKHSRRADLSVVLGSSLRVTPASTFPLITHENGGAVVVINLQKTALDTKCRIRVFGPCDEFMALVMSKFDIPVPLYVPRRCLVVGHHSTKQLDKTYIWRLFVCGECGYEIAELIRIDVIIVGQDPSHITSYVQGDILQLTSNLPLVHVVLVAFFAGAKPVAVTYSADLDTPSLQLIHNVTVESLDEQQHGHEIVPPSKTIVTKALEPSDWISSKALANSETADAQEMHDSDEEMLESKQCPSPSAANTGPKNKARSRNRQRSRSKLFQLARRKRRTKPVKPDAEASEKVAAAVADSKEVAVADSEAAVADLKEAAVADSKEAAVADSKEAAVADSEEAAVSKEAAPASESDSKSSESAAPPSSPPGKRKAESREEEHENGVVKAFDIKFFKGAKPHYIRHDGLRYMVYDIEELESPPQKDMAVMVEWMGKGQVYPASILRVLPNDRFDVLYDDGDKELAVMAELVYVISLITIDGIRPKKKARS